MDRTRKNVEPADQEREETVQALLHPDRAHHDELGHADDVSATSEEPLHGHSSPREQGAAPLDMTKVDE
jgi:hypothetical protein